MSWEKVSLFECFGRHIFLDEYGFCRIEMNGVFINDINLSELFAYSDENKRYERIRFGNTGDYSKSIADLFSIKIARKKSTNQPYYNYGYGNDYLSDDQATNVKPKTIKINLRVNIYESLGYNSGATTHSIDKVIELHNSEDIKNHSCWYKEGADTSSFKMVILPETKVGDELYLVGVGKVKVSNLAEYPNKNDAICEAVDMEGKKRTINMESEVFYLPYKKTVDEFANINKSLNELKLSPYVTHCREQNHIYNVYWNKIEDACSYHVVIYKYIELRNRRRVLEIANYEVDRNTCFLSIDKLVGGNFIFKVKAEDRSGKIIAESRGAKDGSPRDFKK